MHIHSTQYTKKISGIYFRVLVACVVYAMDARFFPILFPCIFPRLLSYKRAIHDSHDWLIDCLNEVYYFKLSKYAFFKLETVAWLALLSSLFVVVVVVVVHFFRHICCFVENVHYRYHLCQCSIRIVLKYLPDDGGYASNMLFFVYISFKSESCDVK